MKRTVSFYVNQLLVWVCIACYFNQMLHVHNQFIATVFKKQGNYVCNYAIFQNSVSLKMYWLFFESGIIMLDCASKDPLNFLFASFSILQLGWLCTSKQTKHQFATFWLSILDIKMLHMFPQDYLYSDEVDALKKYGRS